MGENVTSEVLGLLACVFTGVGVIICGPFISTYLTWAKTTKHYWANWMMLALIILFCAYVCQIRRLCTPSPDLVEFLTREGLFT